MAYTGKLAAKHDGQPASKFVYGQYLAASMAHLMVHQQDAVGLVTFDTGIRRYIPARSRVSHLRAILQELSDTSPATRRAWRRSCTTWPNGCTRPAWWC